MSELLIALNQVKPTLIKKYHFPRENIDGYGRVPIQIGSQVIWGDFVVNYYDKHSKKKAFCVIEVKECSDEDIEFAIPQAESYAQRLNSPYFCCTNGNVYLWFITGSSQGESITLKGPPTLPDKRYLKKPKSFYATPYLFEAISNFESNVKVNTRIYNDSKWHNDTTNQLNKLLEDKNLYNKTLILNGLNDYTMNSRGKTELLKNITLNYSRFIDLINYLKRPDVPIEVRINDTVGKHSKYGIEKGGIFFITQLLAALYPMEYTVIEHKAIKSMLRFQITDIDLKGENSQDFLYFNQICRDLFPLFKNDFNFNLSFVHNFLWHYEADYLKNNSWD
ncbi:type I restriction enzyme HsdR N-terminal domain-containing protein [Fictibacillus arsenicus]|uniref:Type I restriction enzyme R protein N-terminal domain-containing protein n=1 Tax=Fictibacillus arsenicus TaxID=255247 RepID=A0A1V3GCE4_9BACL|nr:type I restriction enzyme HsdR N-terminal domain-containing protein [Fictibacillus arsenicus]OOE14061.1 hypothetical protein UN64_02280 [Fictibacillus arsenicus]